MQLTDEKIPLGAVVRLYSWRPIQATGFTAARESYHSLLATQKDFSRREIQ